VTVLGETMLKIEDLHVAAEGNEILRGVDLELPCGALHAVMGPNGSGKSTLAHVLAGRCGYEVTRGRVLFDGRDLLAMEPEERARAGLFLGFQYPVAVPGVGNAYFVRTALNEARRARGLEPLDALDFLELARERAARVGLPEAMLRRPVNEGFSGGEKKRNEIFQMLVLEPRLAVLDETDSGLDVDAIGVIADGIRGMRDPGRSFIVITHYPALLEHLVPDRVHVLMRGTIVRSGDARLAARIAERGFGWLDEPVRAAAAAARQSGP